ncbi:MAG: putative large exoprotein involved in heme utilization or adhesion of ShlA/HecA/FhaA family, partial [Proteobacteria bacterium]|nr:putative large exoprotein involved in heme utilization or adhesion of ShlA/HecA/FhaA family [Pseudomonadota bacterium]
MNKHLHRIIFNKARGVLMAVAECASSHSRGDARVSLGNADIGVETAASWLLRPAALAILLVTSGTVGFIPYAEAQIVADPTAPRNQQPTILNAANGVPVVNIQTPSAAGVSRNTYSQFDVQANGAILNNARSNVQTQQGGWVQGNPWLAAGSARVILNEVNSSNPSQLRGYVEVAGSRAQVVIANPAGVTCDGCGFINANRVTLTTGTPILNGGNLEGFRVERGQLLIQGNGLDTRQADYTDLIARAITVNAGVWANTLKLVAGANQVDAEAGTASRVSGVGAAPSVAIDVGQLGGMYAGKIALVGTEAGVGVRNAGQIGAASGEVSVTVDGRLINSGVLSAASQALNIASHGLDNTGTLTSQADLAITSQGDVVNAGLINAGRELKLDVVGPIDNSGTLSGQRLDLSADRLDNTGILRQTGSQGLALSVGNITNQAAATLGHLVSGATVPTPSSSSSPTTSGTADAPSSAATGGEVNSLPATPEVLADGRIVLRGDLANSGQLTANGRVEVSATRLDNRGTVNLDTLSVTGDRLLNTGGTLIVTDLAARVTTVDNTAGQIKVARTLSIDANDLSNTQGSILYAGTGNMGIQLAGPLNNASGLLQSAQDMSLTTGALDNDAGLIQAAGALTIDTQGQALSNRNTGSGGIVSQGALTIHSGSLDNRAGYVGAMGPMVMQAGAVNNAGGLLLGGSSTHLTLASLDNSGGQIQSAGNLTVNTSGNLGNTGGLLRSGATLTLQASQIDNNQTNSSNKGIEGLDVVLTAPLLNNSSGAVRADNNLTFTSGGSL